MTSAVKNPSRRWLFWLAIFALCFLFIYAIRTILLPFVVGIFIAYFLDPAADRLERLGLKRGMATTLIILLFFALLAIIIALVAPLIVHQCGALIAALPEYAAGMQQRYGGRIDYWLAQLPLDKPTSLNDAVGNASGMLVSATGGFLGGLFASSMAFLNLLSLLLITPLVAFYMLRDWDVLKAQVDGLLPLDHADTVRAQLVRIDAALAGFIRGQLNVCALTGVYYAVLLSIVGLPFGALIGFATGALLILPYIGFGLGFLISVIVAFVHFGFATEFWLILGIFAVGQLIESYFLTPRLVGERVGLHPLWIIFGMLAGAALFGLVGVLLAVPVTAVAGVLIRFAVERYRASGYYRGR